MKKLTYLIVLIFLAAGMFLYLGTADNEVSTDLNQKLITAVCRGSEADVIADLLAEGIELSYRTEKGMTLLHLAAAYNPDPEVIELLIKEGLDPLEIDYEKRTPYHLAVVSENNSAVLQKLAENGGEKIIAQKFSEEFSEMTLEDLLIDENISISKFAIGGKTLMTIEDEAGRKHIRFWHKYRDDYFLTALDFKFEVPPGSSPYKNHLNFALSENGKITAFRDLSNNKIYISGYCFPENLVMDFKEAAGLNDVDLIIKGNYQEGIELLAVYEKEGEFQLKKWSYTGIELNDIEDLSIISE